ncbi:hypothetical protein [Nocardia sp. CA-145437]|uniref:hypothetical protein n=1 Tax=Nocardia sp. CA-145437 TaxID=3239980 RepID=UPI003D999FC7
MTGVDTSFGAKAAAGIAKPVGIWFWRRIHPEGSCSSPASHTDAFAGTIRRRETIQLDQLRGGPDAVMDMTVQEQCQSDSTSELASCRMLGDSAGSYRRRVDCPLWVKPVPVKQLWRSACYSTCCACVYQFRHEADQRWIARIE